MNGKIVSSVMNILAQGRISDLIDLMEGDSEFSSGSNENIPKTRREVYVYNMALRHLKFLKDYGLGVERVIVDDKVFESYPDYFQEWLDLGCKGVEEDEIGRYLESNPLRSIG
ncbi:hypothetical protein [Metapseudomonas otitidis]|uniref:hypothetical protein n=1 Tax=Metapseudomonas otitidis TaxID=319939 RepID=UPI0013F5E7F4|nr:hypothetical protein [Pseudomonas otitidis]